jgi:betaine-aldehyde dehydrogenase
MLKLGAPLAAGATVVVKPAPEAPLDAILLADAIRDAGIPAGVVNIVPAGREVGEHLVRHPRVDKIAFTGSTAAGRRIASICGEQLKRVTLELGGKSAAIILDDADLPSTIAGLMPGALMNNGQACVAQTRILASRARYREVTDAVVEAVRAWTVGDPMDPTTPVAAQAARARSSRPCDGEGGRADRVRRRRPGMPTGWYVEPTVSSVENGMRIAGGSSPVLASPYDDRPTRSGSRTTKQPAGSVWTADADHGLDVARRVRTGTYTVNGFAMEFGAPFGGFKCSGVGR